MCFLSIVWLKQKAISEATTNKQNELFNQSFKEDKGT